MNEIKRISLSQVNMLYFSISIFINFYVLVTNKKWCSKNPILTPLRASELEGILFNNFKLFRGGQ